MKLFYKLNFHKHLGGIRAQYFFPNGYGVSVVKNKHSYGGDKGLYELAVIKRNGCGTTVIDYSTKITSDVLGYLGEPAVDETMKEVSKLPHISTPFKHTRVH